jgi:hypothetical protein
MSGAITPLPNTPSWRGVQLKHRGNSTMTHSIDPTSHLDVVATRKISLLVVELVASNFTDQP